MVFGDDQRVGVVDVGMCDGAAERVIVPMFLKAPDIHIAMFEDFCGPEDLLFELFVGPAIAVQVHPEPGHVEIVEIKRRDGQGRRSHENHLWLNNQPEGA